MSDRDLIERAVAAGWTAELVLLWDEETVPGWRWTGPAGQECFTPEGEVPDAVRLALDPQYRADRERQTAAANGFAACLTRLLN